MTDEDEARLAELRAEMRARVLAGEQVAGLREPARPAGKQTPSAQLAHLRDLRAARRLLQEAASALHEEAIEVAYRLRRDGMSVVALTEAFHGHRSEGAQTDMSRILKKRAEQGAPTQ